MQEAGGALRDGRGSGSTSQYTQLWSQSNQSAWSSPTAGKDTYLGLGTHVAFSTKNILLYHLLSACLGLCGILFRDAALSWIL